jgi:hypothetical protein
MPKVAVTEVPPTRGVFHGFFHRFLAIYLVVNLQSRNLLFGGQVEIALGAFWAVRRSLNF